MRRTVVLAFWRQSGKPVSRVHRWILLIIRGCRWIMCGNWYGGCTGRVSFFDRNEDFMNPLGTRCLPRNSRISMLLTYR